jgi:hypothetical protein
MAILKQNSTGFIKYIGWYGDCDGCAAFDLKPIMGVGQKDVTPISSVEQYKIDSVTGDLVTQTASSLLVLSFGSPYMLWNFSTLECGKAYTIIMAKGDGEIDIPNFYPSVADGGDQGRLVQECGAVVPPSTSQLEFRCQVIDGEEVLQVKNNLRPQHSNFITRDTTNWSSLYYFNPPHNSMTEDAHDLADPYWPDVAVSLNYLNDVNYTTDCCTNVTNQLTIQESTPQNNQGVVASDGVTNANSFTYGGELCMGVSTGGTPHSIYLYLGDEGFQTEFPIGKIDTLGTLDSLEVNFKVTTNSLNGTFTDNLLGKCLKGVIEGDTCKLYVVAEDESVVYSIVNDKVISLKQKNNDGYLQIYVDDNATFMFYGDSDVTGNSANGSSETYPLVYCVDPVDPTPTPTPVPQPTPTPTIHHVPTPVPQPTPTPTIHHVPTPTPEKTPTPTIHHVPTPTPEKTPTPTPEKTPTPTPEADCCADYDNNVEITNPIANWTSISFRGITIGGFQQGGFVCIDELNQDAVESNDFWFGDETGSWAGQISTMYKNINSKIRYTTPDGKCYEGELNASPPNGFNLLTEV